MPQEYFFIVNEEYGSGFTIQEYNGRWYIQEAYRTKDGTIGKKYMSKYKRKGQFITKYDGEPYVFPVGVEITEDVAQAILSEPRADEDTPF
jgi:hypothetical protein